MNETLKQQIENEEFENLFSLLENEELVIEINGGDEKITIKSKNNESEKGYEAIEITLDTLIEILKQKNVLPSIKDRSSGKLFKKIFEKYITEDLLKSYIDTFWGEFLEKSWGSVKALLDIIPDEYQNFAKQYLINYMPPVVSGTGWDKKQYMGCLVGRRPTFDSRDYADHMIIPYECFGDDRMLHMEYPHPDSAVKLDTVTIADDQSDRKFVDLSLAGMRQYIDAKGNIEPFSHQYEIISSKDVLALSSILKQNFEKNPKKIILKVIKELNGKISLSDNRCALLSSDETCIGIFDYDLLFELIKEKDVFISDIANPSKEIMKKIMEKFKLDEDDEFVSDRIIERLIERLKEQIADQEKTLREALQYIPLSQWLMITDKLTEVAPPLVNIKIGEELRCGYLFSSSIKEKIFFVEERAFDGCRLDINYIHEFNPTDQTMQYLPPEKNNILCVIDKYRYSPQTGYFNSKNPEEYYYTGYFDSQNPSKYHPVSEEFGDLSILSLEQVKELIEQYNMIVEDYLPEEEIEEIPIIANTPPQDKRNLKRKVLGGIATILVAFVAGSIAIKQRFSGPAAPTNPTTLITDTNPTNPTNDESENIKPTHPIEDDEQIRPTIPIEDNEKPKPITPEENDDELEEKTEKFELFDNVYISDGRIYDNIYSVVDGENSESAYFDKETEYSIIGTILSKGNQVLLIDIFTPDNEQTIESLIENGYKVEGYMITVLNPNEIQSRNGTVTGFIQATSASKNSNTTPSRLR